MMWPRHFTMIVDRLHHFVLPVVTLSASSFSRLDALSTYQHGRDIQTRLCEDCKGKGLSGLTVIVKHAWHNSLIPIVTLLGFSLTNLIGGAYIVEVIFSY